MPFRIGALIAIPMSGLRIDILHEGSTGHAESPRMFTKGFSDVTSPNRWWCTGVGHGTSTPFRVTNDH